MFRAAIFKKNKENAKKKKKKKKIYRFTLSVRYVISTVRVTCQSSFTKRFFCVQSILLYLSL